MKNNGKQAAELCVSKLAVHTSKMHVQGTSFIEDREAESFTKCLSQNLPFGGLASMPLSASNSTEFMPFTVNCVSLWPKFAYQTAKRPLEHELPSHSGASCQRCLNHPQKLKNSEALLMGSLLPPLRGNLRR